MKKISLILLCLVLMSSLTFAAAKKAVKKSAAPAPILTAPEAALQSPVITIVNKATINGSFRVRYMASESGAVMDAFSLSRARIKLTGEITPDILFLVQPDFAGLSTGGTVSMADAHVQIKTPLTLLKAGQFLLPFGYDSAKYKTIFSAGFNPTYYGLIVNSRDYGVRVSGAFPFLSDFSYDGALVNGTNGADVNKSKDIVGRANYKNNFLNIGLSGYYGFAGAASLQKRDAGIDLEYKNDPCQVVAEYMLGGNLAAAAKLSDAYVQLSAMIENHEPLIKYEAYDPDMNVGANAVNMLTLGYGYYVDKTTKLLVNYNLINEETTQINNNSLLIELQTQI